MVKRPSAQSGQSLIEMTGTLVWLLVAALLAWQIALAGWTVVSAANTARTVARLYSREQDVAHATHEGLRSLSSDGLGTGASVSFDGKTWSVSAKIPIVLPGFVLPGKNTLQVTQKASMPVTG
jgi:hypothetical protein